MIAISCNKNACYLNELFYSIEGISSEKVQDITLHIVFLLYEADPAFFLRILPQNYLSGINQIN